MEERKRNRKKSWGRRLGAVLAFMMMAASLSVSSMAAEAEEKELLKAGSIQASAEHVTQKQPFASGTAGSTYFRIPAFIVTQNGNLLAAADARYGTTGDGGGLDTIASVSMDGGQTWNYSFPLYFPDGDGYTGNNATTIIDPVLVQGADETIYCLADVNPTGVTTMGGYTYPHVGTGYITVDGEEHLALTSDYSRVNTLPSEEDCTVYEYYVGDFDENGYAPVINRADGSASEYGVDKWYNLYHVKNGEYVADLTQTQVNTDTVIQQNAFYAGSVLHVYNTGYIMCAKSTDDGLTWEEPEILNPQIKRDDGKESALLVSPGQGLLTSTGTIVIPFYDHGDGEENASIIWSDDNGATWSRSNDVPGQSAGGWWSSESELVELEDGTLRMFFRSGTGAVCYADAVRNAEDDFEFTKPVNTGVSCTSTCNVTAITYSKKINGKQAILVGAPGGNGRTNGKIFTFLVNEDNSLTLKNTFSVPNSSGAYQYSCMSELDNGTIGLLWENGSAYIRYDNFGITEIVPSGYIPGIHVDIELWANESYTRQYSIDQEYKTGITQQPDPGVAEASLEVEDAEVTTTIPLHAHKANKEYSLSSFSATPDTSIQIEEAEFTLRATDTAGIYTVYNESKNVFLSNENSANTFFASEAAKIKFKASSNGEETTFQICRENDKRYVIFYYIKMDFNSNGSYSSNFETGDYELVLLEKQESISEDDILPGYRRVSQITSGRKYLISYIYEGRVLVLYPTNGTAKQTKLVGEPQIKVLPAECAITLTGKGEGTTEAVIDGTIYRIHCKGNPKINLSAGETYFIENAKEYSSSDPDIASVEAGTEIRKGLFDCISQAQNSLEGYSDTPNWDINLAGAEFVVQSLGDNYTIYNPSEEVYLVNSNAQSYFESTQITQSLTPVTNEDGTVSFEIRRVSNDNKNNRYVYFFYERMGFDAVTAKSGFESRGDFGFEFLEKQDTVTEEDPIPGYKRVSEITSGKLYLITEYYEDGIIVLYPRNGIVNQSKLYQAVEVEGAVITAQKPGAFTTVYIDGLIYDVTIREEAKEGMAPVRESLQALCDAWTDVDLSVYTKESADILKEALGNAEEILADAGASQAALTEATADLVRAIGGLEYGVQKLHLETAIEVAEKLLVLENNYNDTEALKAAIADGKSVLNDAQATQQETDEAAYAVLDELAKLAKKADVTSLESLIKAAEGIVSDKYTSDSVEVLKQAIENGKAVLEDPGREDDAVSDAYGQIIDAIIGLQMRGNKAALAAMIVRAEQVLADEAFYVADSLEGIQEELTTARAIYEDSDALQDEIDESVRALTLEVAQARLLGDVNGDGAITTDDTAEVLRAAAELCVLTEEDAASADVNGDGVTDTVDAALILQYTAEKITTF